MTAPGHDAPPSPLLFFDTMNAYQRTRALHAAIELDLFTAIGEGNDTPPLLAKRCAASERGVRILADYMTVVGFLTKVNGRYLLTRDTAAFLDRRSPTCITSAVGFLGSPMLMEHFDRVADAVRKGGTVRSELGSLEPEHPIWVQFAKGMAPLMRLLAGLMTQHVGEANGRKHKVLDIAAGHGMFGITVARQYPGAEIVAVDWPNVLDVARANADAAGVNGRYHTLPGSAFDVEFGNGYDLVLLTNILHHFDTATCEQLLRKVHAALQPGGRAFTVEFVPNEDRVSPPAAAGFSLTMLASSPAGDAYTFAEYERMFRNTGFRGSELHPLPPSMHSLVIAHK